MNINVEMSQEAIADAAEEAASVLRCLANPARLRILCALVPARQSVGQLCETIDASQPYISAQLARLRNEGLVQAERDGRVIHYSLADPRVTPVLERLYEVFCQKD